MTNDTLVGFTAWLIHLDVPTTDGRVVLGAHLPPADLDVPVWVLTHPGYREIGRLRSTWVDERGWLRGSGVLTERPPRPDPAVPTRWPVGVELDAADGDVRASFTETVFERWSLRGVVIYTASYQRPGRPAWPDARLELSAARPWSGPARVDPLGCGCTDCLTGYSVPLFEADQRTLRRLLAGEVDNASGYDLDELVIEHVIRISLPDEGR